MILKKGGALEQIGSRLWESIFLYRSLYRSSAVQYYEYSRAFSGGMGVLSGGSTRKESRFSHTQSGIQATGWTNADGWRNPATRINVIFQYDRMNFSWRKSNLQALILSLHVPASRKADNQFFFFFFFGLFFVVFFAEDLRKIKRENRGILKQVKDTPSIP